MAESRLTVPALGAPLGGAPVLLAGAGGLPAGVGAPPVPATAVVAKLAAIATKAAIESFATNQSRASGLPCTACPLFRSPTELAVGLALKEMRYGSCSSDSPPRPARSLRFLRPLPAMPVGTRRFLARQYRARDGYDPAAAPGSLRGFCAMKTYVATAADRQRDWYVVDAEGQTLGRLATRLADALRGKRKPEYTPHVDTGDFIVVVNAEKIRVTGDKLEQKVYWRHSGYPGGIKSRTLAEMLDRRPEEVIRKAVKGMLPRNRLARQQLTKLKVYAGPDHPHAAQQPKPMEIEK